MGLSLLTDLYQLTMLCAYFENGKTDRSAFELFVRKLPPNRNYLVFLGLEEIKEVLENLRFSPEDLDYLYGLKLFPDTFLDYLKEFRFTGTVYAMDDGQLFFPYEPVVRVEAPILEAQLLETVLMNQLHVPILIASKAARVYTVSRGRALFDFSLRRTHGKDAGLKVAKATYAAGFKGTSNVLAGKLYSIPVVGTVAHSFIMAFESEEEAFRAYLKVFPQNGVLLIDTYDPIRGAERAVKVAKEMGVKLKGVRIDSGDLVEVSKKVRKILDEAGFFETKIILSGGLDEYRIDSLLKRGAVVDAFGVGTKVGTSADAPFVDLVYKMVEYGGKPVMKVSSGKRMYPGRKQVFRKGWQDYLTLFDETAPGEPLLKKKVENGSFLSPLESLKTVQERLTENLNSLPEELKDIYSQKERLPKVSPKLEKLYLELREALLGG